MVESQNQIPLMLALDFCLGMDCEQQVDTFSETGILIHLFTKYLLSAKFVSGVVLGCRSDWEHCFLTGIIGKYCASVCLNCVLSYDLHSKGIQNLKFISSF